ncbi:hypothetical protein JR316_0013057 [Psilocybe cubensis]|nr:hypothetical protein JR316_0013057 [Psilocybe cubensis]KAH9474595.1 hypothetical protein JR316_0013057 [Psilocybe cubensis]
MPALVISRGSSAASASASLPLNQPPAMRILKRPSPTVSPNQSSANLTPAGETFKEREARYQAARERIFGVSSSTSSDGQDKDGQDKAKNSALKKASSPTPPSNQAKNSVVRDPRGPSNSTPNPNSENRTDNKGFGERRTQRPPPSTAVPTTIFPVSSSDIPI